MRRRYLIGIGPGKSGSTWLYSFFNSSSEICCSNVKETGYFSRQSDVVEAEYLNKYFRNRGSKSIFCEVSNTYIYDPAVTDRFKCLEAKVDLVAVLRDPVERAISHVHQLIRNGERFDSFESALHKRPDILARGLYVNYLNNYLDLPSNVSLHIFCFDELATTEEIFKARLLNTLGLDPSAFQRVKTSRFPRSAPRSRLLAILVKKAALTLRQLGFTSLIQRVKNSSIPALLYAPTTQDQELAPKPDTLIFMRKFFYLADRELGRQWGVDVSQWQSQADGE